MVNTVIKRSGKKESFSRAKLERAIDRAAKEGRVNAERRREISKEVSESVKNALSKRRTIKTTELRRRVLDRLERRSRAIASAWRSYDRRKR